MPALAPYADGTPCDFRLRVGQRGPTAVEHGLMGSHRGRLGLLVAVGLLLRIARVVLHVGLIAWLGHAGTGAAAAQTEYRLDVGDRIRVTVLEQPTLSGEFAVGPSASLSLPLVGRVNAQGLTTDALETLLAERLVRIGGLREPKVSIEMVAFRPFYVLGAVESPGQYAFVPEMTVLHAISLAGGFRRPVVTESGNEIDVARLHERHDTLGDTLAVATARRARLIAERDGLAQIDFPDSIRALTSPARAAEIMTNERRIRDHRVDQIRGESTLLGTQKAIVDEEIDALGKQIAAKVKLQELNAQEMAEIDKLRQRDLVPITRVLALRRSATELESDRIQLIAAVARARQEMARVEINLETLRRTRSVQVAEALKQAEDDIAQLSISRAAAREQIRQAEFLLGRTSTMARQDELAADLVIIRRGPQGIREIKADDLTPVMPGDLIKVPMRPLFESERSTARRPAP